MLRCAVLCSLLSKSMPCVLAFYSFQRPNTPLRFRGSASSGDVGGVSSSFLFDAMLSRSSLGCVALELESVRFGWLGCEEVSM